MLPLGGHFYSAGDNCANPSSYATLILSGTRL